VNRNYAVQPIMFVTPGAMQPVSTPDAKLVADFHRLLDMIPNDNHALMIDMVVSQILRTHIRPDGQFEPELLPPQKGNTTNGTTT
jgi:hypothetical protein